MSMIIHCRMGYADPGAEAPFSLFESASGGVEMAPGYTIRRRGWRRGFHITPNFHLGVILVGFVSFCFPDNIYGLDTYIR